MNLSFPKANLRILESRIKYKNMNNSYNNSQIDKNRSFQKSSDIIKKKFNINALTKKYKNKNINIQFYKKNAASKSKNLFNDKNKQIRLMKSKYFHNDLIQKKVNSPIKREYKNLLSIVPNNKRCFINLHNKDLDNIFKLNIPNSNFTRAFNQRKPIMINKKYKKDISVNTNKSLIFSKKKESERIRFEPKIKIHYKISSNSCKNNTQDITLNKNNKSFIYSSSNNESITPLYKSKSNINKVKYLYLMLKLSTPSKIKLKLLNGIKDEEFKIKDSISCFISKYNRNML